MPPRVTIQCWLLIAVVCPLWTADRVAQTPECILSRSGGTQLLGACWLVASSQHIFVLHSSAAIGFCGKALPGSQDIPAHRCQVGGLQVLEHPWFFPCRQSSHVQASPLRDDRSMATSTLWVWPCQHWGHGCGHPDVISKSAPISLPILWRLPLPLPV